MEVGVVAIVQRSTPEVGAAAEVVVVVVVVVASGTEIETYGIFHYHYEIIETVRALLPC